MAATVSLRTNSNGIGSGGQPMIEKAAKTLRLYFKVAVSGSYATTGDTLDLTALFGTSGLPGYSFPTASLPERVEIQSVLGTASAQTNLFIYSYVPGTSLANGKFQVFTGAAAQTALTELSAGAYPAGITGDVIEGIAIIPVP